MAIDAKVIVVGGNKFVHAPDSSSPKSPQDLVKTTGPVRRVGQDRVEHASPQDSVPIHGEPKITSSKNDFILKSSSRFHRDMIEE